MKKGRKEREKKKKRKSNEYAEVLGILLGASGVSGMASVVYGKAGSAHSWGQLELMGTFTSDLLVTLLTVCSTQHPQPLWSSTSCEPGQAATGHMGQAGLRQTWTPTSTHGPSLPPCPFSTSLPRASLFLSFFFLAFQDRVFLTVLELAV